MADIFDQVASQQATPDVFDQAAQEDQTAAQTRATQGIESLTPNPSVAAPVETPAQSILQKFAQPRPATSAEQAAEAGGGGGYRLNPTAPAQTVRDIPNEKSQLAPETPTLAGPARPAPVTPQQEGIGEFLEQQSPLNANPDFRQDLYTDQDPTPQITPAEESAAQQGVPKPNLLDKAVGVEAGALGGMYDPGQAAQGAARIAKGAADRSGREMFIGAGQAAGGAMQFVLPEMGRAGAMAIDEGTSLIAAGAVQKGLLKVAEPVGMYFGSIAAGKTAAFAAKEAGLTPDVQQAADTIATFLPGMAYTMARNVRAFSTSDLSQSVPGMPEGTRARGVQVPGAGAMVTETPAGKRVLRTYVGPFQKNVTLSEGRQLPAAPPDPEQAVANQQVDDAVSALSQKQRTEAAAAAIAEGVPPAQAVAAVTPKPPAPPRVSAIKDGTLDLQVVGTIAAAISVAPPETRPDLVLQAHSELSNQLEQAGKVVLDGQIQLVKNPQQAQQLAAKIINGKVAELDAARDQQRPSAPAPAKPAEAQNPSEAAEDPAERLYQRAQTILDSNPGLAPARAMNMLSRNLRVPYGDATQLFRRWQQEKAAAALPTVGSKEQPVVEESRATVDAQMQALQKGNINVVMLPQGSSYTPTVPDGFKAMDVKKGPGAGTYVYNPRAVTPATIRRAAENGTHGDLLGHVQPKEETVGKPTVAVQASTPEGTPIQDSEVAADNPAAARAQAEVLAERHPGAQVSVKPTDQVINERLAAQDREKQGGDVFDEAAKLDVFDQAQPKDTKYEFGNTQANIPEGSDAHAAIRDLQGKVSDDDLAGKGRDVDAPQVTVRYGIKGDDTAGIRRYLESQAPFEAKLGKTELFPPSKNSDGAAVLMAPVESPDLHRMNEEIAKHGDFKESDFKEYKPHATIAYVKPEAAEKYRGMADAEGKSFPVRSVFISDRNGNKEEVQLKGSPDSLSERGVEATMEAARKANPASKRSEDQQRADAEADIAGQKEHIRLLEEFRDQQRRERGELGGTTGGVEPAEPAGSGGSEEEAGAHGRGNQEAGGADRAGESRPAEEKPPVRAGEPVARAAREERPAETPSGKVEPYRAQKGDVVRFLDRDDKEHTGTVRYANALIAAIKTEDGKEYKVGHKKVLGLAGAAKSAEPSFTLEPPPSDVALRRKIAEYFDSLPENQQEYARAAFREMVDAGGGHDSDGQPREITTDPAKWRIPQSQMGALEEIDDDVREFADKVVAKPKGEAQNGPNGAGTGERPAGGGRAESAGRNQPAAEQPEGIPAAEGERETPEVAGQPGSAGDRGDGLDNGSGERGAENGAGEPVPQSPDGAAGAAGAAERTGGPNTGAELAQQPGSSDRSGQPGTVAPPATPEQVGTTVERRLKNRNNFRIEPEDIPDPSTYVQGGEITRIQGNIRAIKLVKKLIEENRAATRDEQKVLAQYVGWGGLKNAFENWRSEYRKYYDELQDTLSREEFEGARRSTLNAHYTSPEIIQGMWKLARRLGFSGGTVLEPSMGVGHFFGLMPRDFASRSDLIGVELDPITDNIARNLYPDAQIAVKGYQDVVLPDNSIHFAIGNVPFADIKIRDKRYTPSLSIHNYFFAKTMDKLKPGAGMAMITSRYTMDSATGADFRERLASQADLVGAIRLPDTTFKKNAGTEVVTDILVFRKRYPGEQRGGQPFAEIRELQPGISVNEYFATHPEHVLGEHSLEGSMYAAKSYTVTLPKEMIGPKLDAAISSFPKKVFNPDMDEAHGERLAMLNERTLAPDNVKNGAYTVHDGKVVQNVGGMLQPLPLEKAGQTLRIMDAIKVREAAKNVIRLQLQTSDDTPVEAARKELNRAYDQYTGRHGLLNGPKTAAAMEDDPEYPLLLSLENYDPKAKKAAKAAIFTKRTSAPYEPLNKSTFPQEPRAQLSRILAATGRVDLPLMYELSGQPIEKIAGALAQHGLIYRDPASGDYQTADAYLSGNVRQKLNEARAAAELNPEFQPNIAALEKVQPPKLTVHEIDMKPGMTWVPMNVYEDFIRHLSGDRYNTVRVVRMPGAERHWQINTDKRFTMTRMEAQWAAGGVDGMTLLEQALNQKLPTVYSRDPDGNPRFDGARTMAARDMQQKIKDEFQRWARDSEQHQRSLEDQYNELVNNIAEREHDGSHLEFPGMNADIRMNPHQSNFAWRVVQDGRGLAAHVVGAGKTFESIAAAMELRRMGLSPKNLFVVPNNMLAQWRDDWQKLYPGANVLAVNDKDFEAKNRRKIMARIATGDYDGIIITHSQFDLMTVSPELEGAAIAKEVADAREVLEQLNASKENRSSVKRIEKQILKLEERLKELNSGRRDNAIYYDDLGVSSLFVDEAHYYKNLSFYTHMGQVSGLNNSASQKASRMKMKTDHMLNTYKGRGVVFLTGTPITNTLAEMYNITRYIAPDLMANAGIHTFDDWAANFGNTVSTLEYAPDGVTLRPKIKFTQFSNVPELSKMFRTFADVKMRDDIPGLKVPKANRHNVEVTINSVQEPLLEQIVERGERLGGGRGQRPDPKEDNWLKLSSDARKMSLDPRLYDASSPDAPMSKVNAAADKIAAVYKEGAKTKATQLVFSDFFQNIQDGDGKKPAFDLFQDLREKLVKRGIPKNEIATIYEAGDDKDALEAIFEKMRDGRLRVLMGSTAKMGVGVNVQKRLKALHHLDQPWRPADVDQREGRIIRQGNDNDEVDIYRYISKPQEGKVRRVDPKTGEMKEVDRPKAFDLQMFQKLEQKQSFINQIMSGKFQGRKVEDPGGQVLLDYKTMMAVSTGNPDVFKKVELTHELTRLESLERVWRAEKSKYVYEAERAESMAAHYAQHAKTRQAMAEEWKKTDNGKKFSAVIDGKKFAERKEATAYLDERGRPFQTGDQLELYGQPVYITETQLGKTLYPKYEVMGDVHDLPSTPAGLVQSVEYTMRDAESSARLMREQSEKFTRDAADYRAKVAEANPFAEKIMAQKDEISKINVRLGLNPDGSPIQETDAAVEVSDKPDVDEGDEGSAPVPKRTAGGTTLRASAFGLDLAAEAAAKIMVHEFKTEVKPFLMKAGTNLHLALRELQAVVVPRSLAQPDALDNVMSALGRREKRAFILEQALNGFQRAVGKLSEAQQIDVIDRLKTGQQQVTPELDALGRFIRQTDEDTYRDVVEQQALSMSPAFKKAWNRLDSQGKDDFFRRHEAGMPQANDKLQRISDAVLDYKENHFRVMWKVIPGSQQAKGGKPNAGRGPLHGTKGFLKKATLANMSDGIAMGGVPWSYNPITLFKMSQTDAYRYITALQIWRDAKDDGARVFVKRGERLPEGFEYVEDRIGDVKFRAASGEGMIEAGKWAMRSDYATLLNHFLSKDWVRSIAIGKGLMWTKNQLTAWRLGFSPFHAFTTSVSSIASHTGLAFSKMNRAAREMDAALAGRALKDVATAALAPVADYRVGTSLFRYVADPKGFIQTSRGQDLVKQYPGLDQMIDAAFTGGAKLALHQDERLHSIQAFKQAVADKRALAALFHSVPALNQFLMTPLFEYYIPRVKFAGFVREFSERLADRNDDVAKGEITIPRLARETWDSVEDVFGQMNWDKFFWHNTFKAAVQLAFRAFTWFAGNVRLVGRAFTGQAQEMLESLKYLNEQFNSGSKWGAEYTSTRAIPRLHPDMGKLLGLVATFVLSNVILQALLAHEVPQDWKDYVAARIGGNDQYGKPRRVILPAIVLKDMVSLWYGGATNYLQAKESDLIRGLSDVLENEDFRHAMVHDPDDPFWKQRLDDAEHIIGSPIGVGNILRGGEEGQPLAQRILTGAGFSNAPYGLDLSPAERRMIELHQRDEKPRTEAQIAEAHEAREQMLRSHTSAGAKARAEAREPELEKLFRGLSYIQARDVYEHYATPEERRILRPLWEHKRYSALRRNPETGREAQP